LALTDEDAEARRLVVSSMREAGLAVRVDRIGTVYAERAGDDPTLPCVLMGSHIDTVATGGAFDGTLGVLGGIPRAGARRAVRAGSPDRRSA
jgi:N-carbamoyl-L-amino-acid hydrolase